MTIDGAGHILTNHHVVAGARTVSLVLSTGRTVGAEVVGSDESNDVAVLRATGGDLPPAALGVSADLRIGQPVIAVGSPARGAPAQRGRNLPPARPRPHCHPTRRGPRTRPETRISARIAQLLDTMRDVPAIAMSRFGDPVASNALGRALFPDLFPDGTKPLNSARYLFLDPRAQTFYPDWETVAREGVCPGYGC